MAPEFPADLIVLDLRFEEGGLGDKEGKLLGKLDVIERDAEARNERLHVTWNAEVIPKDFLPVAGGVVSIPGKLKTIRFDYEIEVEVIGDGRYAWAYHTHSDLMMVLVFPEGYVPDDCKPYPIRAKRFEGRAVAYWRFGEHGAEVRWTMRKVAASDVAAEVLRINKKAVRKPNPAGGPVIVDDPIKTQTTWFIVLLGVLTVAFLMLLIFYGPRDLPDDYKPIVRFIAALAGALLAGSFAGRLSLEGRLPAFADGIPGNSLGIAAAGGFAMFVFVMLFWAR